MFYPVLFLYPREVFPTMHRGGVPVQEQPMCERVSPLWRTGGLFWRLRWGGMWYATVRVQLSIDKAGKSQ